MKKFIRKHHSGALGLQRDESRGYQAGTAPGVRIYVRGLMCGVLCVLSCFALTVDAATVADIAKDMQPLTGYVVDQVSGQVILNLGKEAGVKKGDLFTVFQKGKKLIDPTTGKILGSVENRSGVLGVTRVEKIFSYSRPLKKKGRIKRGDKVVRFKELTAATEDKTGQADHFFFQLKERLSDLDWQDNAKNAELVFVRENNLLKVLDGKGKLLREYEISAPVAAVSTAPPAQSSNRYAPVYAAGAAGGMAAMTAAGGKVRYDMQTYGYNQAGVLPYSAVMGDFAQINGQEYLAVIREHDVYVYQLQEQSLLQVARFKVPLVKLISVCWWQPQDGTDFVAATGYDQDEQQVSSLVLRFAGNALKPVQQELPYIVNSSDVDGNGNPETLLGQEFDQDVFFGRGIRQLVLTGNKIKSRSYTGPLPNAFRVTGGTVFTQPQGRMTTAAYIVASKLHIAEGGRDVYTSGKEMGGSVSAVRYEQNPDDINPLFSTANIEIRPLAVDIDNDGSREILVPSADLSVFSSVGGANTIKKTWVSVLKKTGAGSYMKGRIGGTYDQYIQAMGSANNMLYLLTVDPGGIFSEARGSSRLLILPLQE